MQEKIDPNTIDKIRRGFPEPNPEIKIELGPKNQDYKPLAQFPIKMRLSKSGKFVVMTLIINAKYMKKVLKVIE